MAGHLSRRFSRRVDTPSHRLLRTMTRRHCPCSIGLAVLKCGVAKPFLLTRRERLFTTIGRGFFEERDVVDLLIFYRVVRRSLFRQGLGRARWNRSSMDCVACFRSGEGMEGLTGPPWSFLSLLSASPYTCPFFQVPGMCLSK